MDACEGGAKNALRRHDPSGAVRCSVWGFIAGGQVSARACQRTDAGISPGPASHLAVGPHVHSQDSEK